MQANAYNACAGMTSLAGAAAKSTTYNRVAAVAGLDMINLQLPFVGFPFLLHAITLSEFCVLYAIVFDDGFVTPLAHRTLR
jgi:hypothetical protein